MSNIVPVFQNPKATSDWLAKLKPQMALALPKQLAQGAMVEEARKALEAFSRGDVARYDLHRLNARRLANALGLSALPQRQEVAA